MVNIQVAAMNESTTLANDQARLSLPALKTRLDRDLAHAGKESESSKQLCVYVNTTSKVQIARITNISNWYFERVIFPGQRLLFEALPQAQLEIHTGMTIAVIRSDTIPCSRLCKSFS